MADRGNGVNHAPATGHDDRPVFVGLIWLLPIPARTDPADATYLLSCAATLPGTSTTLPWPQLHSITLYQQSPVPSNYARSVNHSVVVLISMDSVFRHSTTMDD